MVYKEKNKLKEKSHLPYDLPYELRGRKMKSYPLTPISEIKNKGDAIAYAIDYQNWSSEQNLSYGEIVKYQNHFEKLGKKFKLTNEFKENGII